MIPNVLSIAGIDPSGGAGVLADLKTFSALGAYGCAIVTALTAQNTHRVDGVMLTEPEFVAMQIITLFDDVRIDAVKIGMLGSAALIEVVANGLREHASRCPIVLDPVMVAKSGDALLQPEAVAALRDHLLPLATVLTPNLPEAAQLTGQPAPRTVEQMHDTVRELRRSLRPDNAWVMLKGGHLAGPALDLLYDGKRTIELSAERIATKNTHGTGCTLSAAIAALLPAAADVPRAVSDAKDYLTAAISHSGELSVGSGHGPVHHFHKWWIGPRG